MREPLTTQLVAEEISKLVVAFPGNLAAKTNPAMLANTYRHGLEGLVGDAVRAAVQICIREDVYFPKVARLREVAGEWTRRNRDSFTAKRETAWDICPICGVRATTEPNTRAKLYKPDGEPWYYLTTTGAKIPRKDLLTAQARGIVFETETVIGQRTVMNHDPARHHVRRGDSDEYEAAS